MQCQLMCSREQGTDIDEAVQSFARAVGEGCVFAKHRGWQICHVHMNDDATARRSGAPLQAKVVTGYSVNFEPLCFNK